MQRLGRPPITEAVINLRVSLPSDATLARLEPIHQAVRDRYPEREPLFTVPAEVAAQGTPQLAEGGPYHDGWLYRSADGRQVIQARLGGFSFSRLSPYESWRAFRDEARALWEVYLVVAKPLHVTRVALRFINRIAVPLPIFDLRDYFRMCPEIPEGLPRDLSGLFMRIVVHDPNTQAVAIITQATEPMAESGQVIPFVFDIDVFHEETSLPEGEQPWVTLEKLRYLKNELFFKSVTEKTLDLCR